VRGLRVYGPLLGPRPPSTRLRANLLILAVLAAPWWTGPARAQGVAARALISAPIDERQLYRLRGGTRPEANAQNDRGRVPDELAMQHMQLVLRRPNERDAAMQQFQRELHDRSSSNFHHWLSPSQFEARFGVGPQDTSAIMAWLAQHGFVVNAMYPGLGIIDFTGTAGEVRATLHTEIHYLDTAGTRHIGNMSDPQVPAALAPAVQGVVSLHDFPLHPNFRPAPAYTYTGVSPTRYQVVPADLATIYNLGPLFAAGTSGQGQTIAVLEDTDLPSAAASDWSTFRTTFGLAGYTSGSLTSVHPGGCTHGVVATHQEEAEIDAEWASAAAPSATVEVASCASTSTYGVLIALEHLVNGGSPPGIVSISYGMCEALLGSANAAFAATYAQAVAEGISVFVAAGDAGAAFCDDTKSTATHGIGVNGMASTPYDVAVGGTDFGDSYAGTVGTYWSTTNDVTTYGSALSYVPEIPWDDSCASSLLVAAEGYGSAFGSNGFCNSTLGITYLTTTSGSGGPSQCATGVPAPATPEVISGSCGGYAKPAWQSGAPGNPADGLRDLPDVSLFAGSGFLYHSYVVCDSALVSCAGAPGTWSRAGGTSFAAPILAGIQALVDQGAGLQGNPNPVYYALAASQDANGSLNCMATAGRNVSSGCVFHDVTNGDNDVNCTGAYGCFDPSGSNGVLSQSTSMFSDAYATGAGWDSATGLGSVNAANLVRYWNSADLSLTVTGTALNSGLLSYSVRLGNTGPQSAAGVTVSSSLPGGVMLITGSSSPECTQSGQALLCAVGTMIPGASPSLTIVLQPGGLSSVNLTFVASTATDSNLDLNNDVASLVLTPYAGSAGSSTGDGPLPLWSLVALGAGLCAIVSARRSGIG